MGEFVDLVSDTSTSLAVIRAHWRWLCRPPGPVFIGETLFLLCCGQTTFLRRRRRTGHVRQRGNGLGNVNGCL